MLKISELAGLIGLSAHTIRFYEKHGLIEASERSESGYRLYSAADINRAEFVKTARNIGFSLGTLLSFCQSDSIGRVIVAGKSPTLPETSCMR